jgi:Na+-transporting NADH:ubiquinone oxidoreductase subunit B
MKIIEKILQKPLDNALKKTEGGLAHTSVDAVDTVLRNVGHKTKSKVHVRDALDTKRMMSAVLFALIPAIVFGIWNAGYQKLNGLISTDGMVLTGLEPNLLNSLVHGLWHFLPLYAVSMAAGGLAEVVFASVRKHEINEGFLVTGMLIPLIMPAGIPLWMVAVGTIFGVVFAKEVFGGTGFNFLNPALTARAFIFFSYPTKISGDQVWKAVEWGKDKLVDGFSGATPLAFAATAPQGSDVTQILSDHGWGLKELFLGMVPGSIGETSTLAILIGAVILILVKVASWRVILSTFAGGYVMGLIFNAFAGPESSAFLTLPPHYHLVLGGFAFGAVFMTTDPVTSAATHKGQFVYGFLVGALAVLIRVANPAYPEGMMLAILFMNVFAPLIDHFVVQGNIKRRLNRA